MRILVNGEPTEIRSKLTVAELIADLGFTNSWLAIALRGHVLPRVQWAETHLFEHDAIEIVRAVSGGR
jgi:thiamine biosynthesis protein ThiS